MNIDRSTVATMQARAYHRVAALAGLVVAILAVPSPAAAHEKWFIDDPGSFPTDWSFLFRPTTLTLVLAVIVVPPLSRWAANRFTNGPELPQLAALGGLGPYVPRLLAIHLGVSLLAAATSGHFLTYELAVGDLAGGSVLLLIEGVLGAWFITGFRLRPAAITLAAVGPLALLLTGPVGLLSAAYLLGIAAFLALVPPSDAVFGRVEPDAIALRRALFGLRLGTGTALITVAFAEKLANPALAREILRLHPQLDVFALFGVHLPVDTFVAVAGATELLFGLLVIFGALPQFAVLVAAVPFNATLLVFGGTELLGHLPVYGILLTLLVYGSDHRTAALVGRLPALRQRPTPDSAALADHTRGDVGR